MIYDNIDYFINKVKIAGLIIALSVILSACQQIQRNSENSGSTQVIDKGLTSVDSIVTDNEASISSRQENIKSLDDFYKAYHSLKIQERGQDTFYNAADSLNFVFSDMISKVETMDMSTPEGKKLADEFDYSYYDYRFSFEGVADILFTVKGNVFHFDGQSQLYTLWGDSKSLWDSLYLDDSNNSAYILEGKIAVMSKTYEEDVDGDGVDEKIELVYEKELLYKNGKDRNFKGDLVLSLNGNKMIVMKDEEWYTKPFTIINEMPEIRFQKDQTGNDKAIMVIYSWTTNGIGSTAVINAYKYSDGRINDVQISEVDHAIEYIGGNTVRINFINLQKTMNVKFDPDLFKRFLGEGDTFKQQIEAKDTFGLHPQFYQFGDYNGDGKSELCSSYRIRHSPIDLCWLSTYYIFEDGQIKPVQAFVTPFFTDDEKKSYLQGCIINMIETTGYVSIGKNGILDENTEFAYEYTPDEIMAVLQELQDNKFLKLKGDRLYVNY